MKTLPRLPPLDAQQRYTITEAVQYLRTSRQTIYNDIAAGTLATFREGKRRFVPGTEIIRRSRIPPSTQKVAKRRDAEQSAA
jgi:excisionase family DNA binding protein